MSRFILEIENKKIITINLHTRNVFKKESSSNRWKIIHMRWISRSTQGMKSTRMVNMGVTKNTSLTLFQR